MTVPRTTIWHAEPHTLAKHAILRGYLEAWFPILGRYKKHLVYYDGFAGPGRYIGGEEGSPVIALLVARDHLTPLDFALEFVFVEKDPQRAGHLRDVEIPALHLPPHFKTSVEFEEFASVLRKHLDDYDARGLQIAPTFAFVDPFGIKGLPFSLIRRLLSRPHCEVLITFMNQTMQRFPVELAEHINELIGNPAAADLIKASADRVLTARKLYERSLRRVAKFVRFFQMRDRDGVPIYDLFFASNSDLGHYKMKESMWSVDEAGDYSFSDGADPNQTILFSREPGLHLAPLLWGRYLGRKVDTEEILRYTRDETAYLEKHAREALLLLEGRRVLPCGGLEVDPFKRDGKKRRTNSFPPGVLVQFVD